MSDARRDARSAIKAMLVFWCVILEETHGINVPDEAQIAATTRSLAVWHSDKARDARDEGDRDEAPRHAQAAAAARDDRETGRDILRAICEHITRHLDTLLATDDAEQLVSQVKGARYDARGKAYPVAPEGVTIPCPACGERSRVKPDTKDDITCPRCGATGDTAWWGGDAQREPLTLTQLRGYLANGGLYATDRQLRSWADKGILRTLRPGRAPDGRMQDRLFDPLASITAVAEHLAKKRHERRAA